MAGMGEVFQLSVLITAQDLASRVFRTMGITAGTVYGTMAMGALAVGGGIAAIGGAAIEAATSFNQAMGKISALTDTSTAQMQYYQQQILSLAPALDQSPTALAQGLYFVISAGYQGANAINILKLSAEAAAANMTDMKNVSDLLTTAMNAYRVQGLSAGHAMDDLTKIVVNGKVTMSSLATSFGFVAVTAANAGLSFDEASAAVSALSQIAGEHGSRRVMMDLDNALRNLGPHMEQVSAKAEKMEGLKAPWDAAAFAAMNFGQKVAYIAQETGGIGYLDKTQAAAYEATGDLKNLAQATAHANNNFMTLVGGAAAFLPMAMLLGDKMQSYDTILKQMGGDGSQTAAAFAKMRDTTGQQMNMVKVMGETVLTEIGLHILPYVDQFLMGVYHVGDALNSWLAQANNIQTLKSALIGIALVVAAVLVPALGSLMVTIAPVVLAIVGIVAAGILISKVADHFGGWHAILQRLAPVLSVIQGALSAAGAELKAAFADPAIQAALKQFQAALPQILPYLQLLGAVVVGVIVVGFHLFLAALRGFIGALPGIIQMVQGLLEILGNLGRLVIDIFTGKWGDILPAVKAIGQGIYDTFVGSLRAILGFLGGFGQHILEALGLVHTQTEQHAAQQKASDLQHKADALARQQTFYQQQLANLKEQQAKLDQAYTTAHTPAEKAAIAAKLAQNTHAQQAAAAHIQHTSHARQSVLQHLHLLAEQSKGPLQKFGANVSHGMHQAWQHAGTAVQEGITNVKHGLQTAGTGVLNALKWPYEHNYYVKAYVDDQVKRWREMVAWLGGVWNGFVGFLGTAWDTIKSAVATAWGWVHDHIVQPVSDAIAKVLGFIGGLATTIGTAVKKNVVDPIQKAWDTFVAGVTQWGVNLMANLIKGIEQKLGDLGNTMGQAAGTIWKFLGFHSPTKEGPGSTADQWAPNLIRMYAAGITASLPLLTQAVTGASSVLANGLTSGVSAGLAGAGGTGSGSSLGPTISSVSASSATTIHAHFPNATDTGAIKQALSALIAEHEQATYRATRRPGYGGGLRAGLQ